MHSGPMHTYNCNLVDLQDSAKQCILDHVLLDRIHQGSAAWALQVIDHHA